MAITQAMPTSFKVEILQAVHNFGPTSGNTFKIALYTSSATLSAATTVYSSSNEVSSTNYTAGGNTLTVSVTPTSTGTTAYISFTSPSTWSGVTFTARGALIYNATQGNKAVAVIDFGADQTVAGGDFNVIFPTANSTSAILRIE